MCCYWQVGVLATITGHPSLTTRQLQLLANMISGEQKKKSSLLKSVSTKMIAR